MGLNLLTRYQRLRNFSRYFDCATVEMAPIKRNKSTGEWRLGFQEQTIFSTIRNIFPRFLC